ncbi:MAG: histidine--tRNA ligase [Gammaproteobacteria bacterium]
MTAQKLQAVRGMNDLLPQHSGAWQRVEAALREVARAYGYREIRTPLVERAELFTQSIGDATDIVEKEMYVFDSADERLALRPEATASTVRACNQHGLLHNRQQRLWYLGAMFRRERPQKGRYRQFHQFGVEAFGWPGPDIDAEVIRLGARIWEQLEIGGVRLQLNTLGSPKTRRAYRDALQTYFSEHRGQLDPDSARRLQTNPLRILDSKIAATIEIAAGAPDILAFLDADARAHFDGLCDSLRRCGLQFEVNPRLVRGLDYYTGVVFEWLAAGLGAQNAVCAGGRYDQLVEQRGGRPTPAVGFAMGLERLVELAERGAPEAPAPTDIYVLSEAEDDCEAVDISESLRRAGFAVTTHCGGGQLKRRMKRADQSGARVAVIAGLAGAGTARIKPLRSGGEQMQLGIDALVDWCRHHI